MSRDKDDDRWGHKKCKRRKWHHKWDKWCRRKKHHGDNDW
jgi:hypothetical protein